MKTLFILFTCLFLSHSSAQQKQNNLLLAYIEQTYVKSSLQKLKLLEKDQKNNQKEIEVFSQKLELLEKDQKNNQKEIEVFSQKLELLKQKLINNQKEIEVSKLWPIYFQLTRVNHQALQTDKKEVLEKYQKFMTKIKQKYKDITSKDFPDLEAEYKARIKE